ncbi:MAG: ABC transporter permease [Chloroflexota bacterium]
MKAEPRSARLRPSRKALLVIWHEWRTVVLQPSFLFMAIGFPLITTAYFAFVSSLEQRFSPTPTTPAPAITEMLPGTPHTTAEGFVDLSGLIQSIPEGLEPDQLRPYADELAAQQAIADGQIVAYYIIPEDYLQSGELIYVTPEFSPTKLFKIGAALRRVLQINLVGGDAGLVDQLRQPLKLHTTILEPGTERDLEDPLTMFLPYAVMLIFFFNILMSSSLLLSGLREEINNRTLEVLVSSISARQLLVGKIVSLGATGLLQTGLWGGIGYALLQFRGPGLSVSSGLSLPPAILAWGVVYFLLGYALYASLMAGVGMLVPNLREASQISILVSAPLMGTAIMFMNFILEPNNFLSTALSLFPFTAPIGMMMRLASTDSVPLWQMALSISLLLATTVALVLGVAKIFRAQRLLSGSPVNLAAWLSRLASSSTRN